MRATIALLNKSGHNIITREFKRKYDGYTILYVLSIDGKKYTTASYQQKEAHKHIRKLVEEAIINGSKDNK